MEVEIIKFYLVKFVSKMVLSIKPLLLIQYNKMTVQDVRIKHLKNDKCCIDKFRSTSKLVEGGNSDSQLYI